MSIQILIAIYGTHLSIEFSSSMLQILARGMLWVITGCVFIKVMRALMSCLEEARRSRQQYLRTEKSTVIPNKLRVEGVSFHRPPMDRNQKVLSTVGACTANIETDCEQCQMLQIPVIRFLCPSKGDVKVRKTSFIYSILFIFHHLVKGWILVFS